MVNKETLEKYIKDEKEKIIKEMKKISCGDEKTCLDETIILHARIRVILNLEIWMMFNVDSDKN